MTSILTPKYSLTLYGYWDATHNEGEMDGNSVKVYRTRSQRDPDTGDYIESRDGLPHTIVSFDNGFVHYFRGGYDGGQRDSHTFTYFRPLLQGLNHLSNDDKIIIGRLIGVYLYTSTSYMSRAEGNDLADNIAEWHKTLSDSDSAHGTTPNLSREMPYMNYLMVISMWLNFQQTTEFKDITEHWINDIFAYASELEERNRERVGVADEADNILARELPTILNSFTERRTYNIYSLNGLKHIPDGGIVNIHVGMASTDLIDWEEMIDEVK